MELTDIGVIKDILSRYGFGFSKGLGQNFLINPTVCPRMAEECAGGDVLEIGPGIGVLTAQLAARAGKVVSIELDRRLIPVLGETLSEFDNVKIIEGDVLKIDLARLIADEFGGEITVCANLPYYITTPIIMKLLEQRLPIKAMVLMVQQEAADRLCAPMPSRDAGAVTAAVRYFSDPHILFRVKRGSFMPAPKVDSAVMRLDILKEPPVFAENEALMFKIIRAAFSQRRKTVLNSVGNQPWVQKAQLARLLSEAGVSACARAEQLSLEEFAAIANALNREMN